MDKSNGYERIAHRYIEARNQSSIGVDEVTAWAQSLPSSSRVIDIGCGNGKPVTEILLAAGHELYALDASPTMLRHFSLNFPDIPVRCEAAEESGFFDLRFDAAVAIGILFLLNETGQIALIHKISEALRPGGQLLLTAPLQTGGWTDLMSREQSLSLGESRYREVFAAAGLDVIDTFSDAGNNNHYLASKRSLNPDNAIED